MRSDFHSGTTWALKGNTLVVRVTRQRFSLNMISAVSSPPPGWLCFMVVRDAVNANVFIGFLKRLVHGQRRPIYLIVDGRQKGEELRCLLPRQAAFGLSAAVCSRTES